MYFIVAADDFRLYIRNQAPVYLCDLRHKEKELSCRAPGLGWVLETFNHPVASFPFNPAPPPPPPPPPTPFLPFFESRREDLYLSKRQINRNKKKKKRKKSDARAKAAKPIQRSSVEELKSGSQPFPASVNNSCCGHSAGDDTAHYLLRFCRCGHYLPVPVDNIEENNDWNRIARRLI